MVAGSALAAAMLLSAAPGAQATAIFTQGNNPQPNEENVLFSNPPQSGTTLNGTTNQSHTTVQFDTTQTLSTGGQGQAFLEAVSPATTITGNVTFSIPGMAFKDYIFNPQVGADATGGAATIVAVTNDGTFTQDITLGSGNNFWTVTTTPDEFLLSVELQLASGANYNQYQQPRVSGVCTPGDLGCTLVPIQAPEPASLAVLGGALIGFGLLRRRKRT